jgi:hypothetical protein
MSSRPKSLILCVHSHQPVGNFDNVFEEGYQRSYKPFFEVVEKHPSVPLSCHFSGSLMDWIEAHHPEFIQMLKKMSDRGQLEFIGGGYYEPIYGLIPKKDLAGQIEMMADKLEAMFGHAPEGAWLTERVWDPDLVTPLKKAGVKYTILDDLHFERAGKTAPVTGYYKTYHGKDSVDLFASMKQLRYMMPFRKAEETLDFLHASPAAAKDVFVFADDCEKFGMWPGTYDWVYKERWLDQFLTLLEKDSMIEVYTFKEFRRRFPAQGTVKIPHASYSEMMEWSGGCFYNFMKKYPESGYMRDRMRGVSKTLESASAGKGSFEKLELARKALYKAQCNCSYWHGVFGGLYLHHLRSAVFENLIQADQRLKEASKKVSKKDTIDIREEKFESGVRWRIEQKEITSFFNPSYGAALEELDTLSKPVNLMCNLQRRKEPYHEVALNKLNKSLKTEKPFSIHDILGSKEANLDKFIFYDRNRRLSFIDHFFREPLTPEEFAQSSYTEIGDFVGTPYPLVPRGKKPVKEICFERKGSLTFHDKKYPVTVRKTVSPKGPASVRVHYAITNQSARELDGVFGIEFNFSIGETFAMKGLNEKDVREWVLNDSWRGIRIELHSKEAMNLIAAPVETISESESGLEKTYQELGVLLQRSLKLRPQETQEETFELMISC